MNIQLHDQKGRVSDDGSHSEMDSALCYSEAHLITQVLKSKEMSFSVVRHDEGPSVRVTCCRL